VILHENSEEDLAYRLAQVAPSHCNVVDGATRNTWPGDEIPHDRAGVPIAAVFCQYIATVGDPHLETHIMQIMVRGEPGKRGPLLVKTRAIRNAVAGLGNTSAAFTGKSGARYTEVRATGVRSAGPDDSSSIPYAFIDIELVQHG
jgi:hypothetical protein